MDDLLSLRYWFVMLQRCFVDVKMLSLHSYEFLLFFFCSAILSSALDLKYLHVGGCLQWTSKYKVQGSRFVLFVTYSIIQDIISCEM